MAVNGKNALSAPVFKCSTLWVATVTDSSPNTAMIFTFIVLQLPVASCYTTAGSKFGLNSVSDTTSLSATEYRAIKMPGWMEVTRLPWRWCQTVIGLFDLRIDPHRIVCLIFCIFWCCSHESRRPGAKICLHFIAPWLSLGEGKPPVVQPVDN